MSTWQTPNEAWSDSDTPTPSDFNRIEGNTNYLKDAVDSNDSDILSNASSIASLETAVTNNDSDIASNATSIASNLASITVLNGSGSPQGVGTSNSPSFAGLTLPSYIANGSYTENQIFDGLTSLIPTNGDRCIAIGGCTLTGSVYAILSYAQRISSSEIRLYGYASDQSTGYKSVVNGDSSTFNISLCAFELTE